MAVPIFEYPYTFTKGLRATSRVDSDGYLRTMNGAVLAKYKEGVVEAKKTGTVVNSVTSGIQFSGFAEVVTNSVDQTVMYVVGRRNASSVNAVGNLATDGTFTVIKGSLTNDDFSLAVYDDPDDAVVPKAFVFNGVDSPWKFQISVDGSGYWDGNHSLIGATRPDITQPDPPGTGVTTSLDGVGSNVKGVVKYRIAKMTGTSESAMSATFGEIDCGSAGDGVDVVFPNDAEYNSTTFRIYRTHQNGSEFYYVEDYAVGASGGTYNDDNADSALTMVPYQHGDVPPSEIFSCVFHLNRLFGVTRDGLLYWSDLNAPQSWWTESVGNSIRVFPNDGDVCTGLARVHDGLLIFKQAHVYKLIGRRPEDFALVEVSLAEQDNRSVGLPTMRHLVTTPKGLVWFWEKAIYRYRGGNVFQESPDNVDWRSYPSQIGNLDPNGGLGYDPLEDRLYLSFFNGLLVDEWVYDIDDREWMGVSVSGGSRGYLTISGSGLQALWKIRTSLHVLQYTQSSDGVTGSEVGLPVFFARNPQATKRFNYLDIYYDPTSAEVFDVVYKIDDENTGTTVSVTQPSKDGVWTERVNVGLMGRELEVSIKGNGSDVMPDIHQVVYGAQTLKSVSR